MLLIGQILYTWASYAVQLCKGMLQKQPHLDSMIIIKTNQTKNGTECVTLLRKTIG